MTAAGAGGGAIDPERWLVDRWTELVAENEANDYDEAHERVSGLVPARTAWPDCPRLLAGQRVVAVARAEAAVIAFRLASADAWSSLL